jgi:hypothetical protein
MILSSYIHEQLAAAHRRDLLESAERARLAAQLRRHTSTREPVRMAVRWSRSRRRTAFQSCRCAPSLPTTTT